MVGKAAAMSPAEIRQAGFVIEAYVPIGSNAETRKHPWIIRRRGEGGSMWGRFATRDAAIAMLREELASPDSLWKKPA